MVILVIAGTAASSLAAQDEAMAPVPSELRFIDVTDAVGLGVESVGTSIPRCLFADLNDDGYSDAVVDRRLVYLNLPDDHGESPIGRRFIQVEATGLPEPAPGDNLVFADVDNDGRLDAILTRYVDLNNESWEDHGQRTAWFPGRGDGTFSPPRFIDGLTPKTTAAIGVGDADRDGRLDLWAGAWYVQYGASLDAYRNELALQTEAGWRIIQLPHADEPLAEIRADAGGRPTYGAMIADLTGPGRYPYEPELIELNYGRRWNRIYVRDSAGDQTIDGWVDVAPLIGFDADGVRHGRYPEWAKERFKARDIEIEDELPFRSNGNSFDISIGDIDNDGDFDLFLAEITHGWAGESSDRSRFLLNRNSESLQSLEAGATFFVSDPRLTVDRIPPDTESWNQGDLFCALADLDQDGRLDLLLSSGDYPDDQRLRLYRQENDGTFTNITTRIGLEHDGSQQLSLGDVNGDGALDILVGQTFFRYRAEMKEGREPRLRLFVSQPPVSHRSITIRLEGDPEAGTNRDALGTVVTARIGELTMRRQLIGIGGHAGKQMEFLVHFGLGAADAVDELVVHWPERAGASQSFRDVSPGRYVLRQGESLEVVTN